MTTSKAPVTTSVALVTSSNKKLLIYFKLNSNSFFVTTSKAPVTTSVAPVTSSNKVRY